MVPVQFTTILASFSAFLRDLAHSPGVMVRRMAIAIALVVAGWPVIGHASSTVCWSGRFAGLHEASDRAEAALGDATHDSSHVKIYFEEVDGVFFYQSNYLPAGERSPAKIASTEPLSLIAVLSNVLARRVPGSRIDGATLETASRNLMVYSRSKDVQPEQTDRTFAAQAVVWRPPTLPGWAY